MGTNKGLVLYNKHSESELSEALSNLIKKSLLLSGKPRNQENTNYLNYDRKKIKEER